MLSINIYLLHKQSFVSQNKNIICTQILSQAKTNMYNQTYVYY